MTINETRYTEKLEEDAGAAFFAEIHRLWEITLFAIEMILVITITSVTTLRDQHVCASAARICKPWIRLASKTHQTILDINVIRISLCNNANKIDELVTRRRSCSTTE